MSISSIVSKGADGQGPRKSKDKRTSSLSAISSTNSFHHRHSQSNPNRKYSSNSTGSVGSYVSINEDFHSLNGSYSVSYEEVEEQINSPHSQPYEEEEEDVVVDQPRETTFDVSHLQKSDSDYKRPKPQKGLPFSPILILILLIQIILLILLILEVIALNQDKQWNEVLNGDASFPVLKKNQNFFSGKKLQLKSSRDKELLELLPRDSVLSIVFIAIVVINLLLSLIHALAVYHVKCSTEGSYLTSGLYISIGVMCLVGGSLMVHMVTVFYEHNFRKASDILFTNSSGLRNPYKVLDRRVDQEILGSVFTLCAYTSNIFRLGQPVWKTTNTLDNLDSSFQLRPVIDIYAEKVTIHFIDNFKNKITKTEVYSLKDLQTLGFCSLFHLRSVVYLMSFILAILCWVIPFLNGMRGKYCEYCLKKEEIQNNNELIFIQEDQWDVSVPPHAEGGDVGFDINPPEESKRAKIYPDEAYY